MADNPLAALRGRIFGSGGRLAGQGMAIEVLAGPWSGEYDTRVTGADSERLFLETPVSPHGPVRPDPGTPVRGVLRNHFGSFCFLSTVVSDELVFGHCLAVTMPDELRRLQRRGHVRVPISLPVQVMRLPSPGEELPRAPSFFPGETEDVGAGGLSFTCPGIRVSPGDVVSVIVATPEAARRIQATCEVVRLAQPDGPVAVVFVDLDERAQAELDALVARAHRRARASELAARLKESDGR